MSDGVDMRTARHNREKAEAARDLTRATTDLIANTMFGLDQLANCLRSGDIAPDEVANILDDMVSRFAALVERA